MSNYELPTASADTLGGVKVGTGLEIADGVLSATGGGKADSVDWQDIENKPSDFKPSAHTHVAADVSDLSEVATSGSYDDLTDKPSIPTNTNQLVNGAGFQTAAEVAAAVANANHLKRQIVDALPSAAEADTNTIYMVKLSQGGEQNSYVEYMVVNGQWEKLGTSDVDLSNYVTNDDLTSITNGEIDGIAV